MRARFRLYFREASGRYYVHDDVTGKQESLHTNDKATALRLLHSRNEAEQQPAVNLQIARAYLVASDPLIASRPDERHAMAGAVRMLGTARQGQAACGGQA
jgi:hypothetical protein